MRVTKLAKWNPPRCSPAASAALIPYQTTRIVAQARKCRAAGEVNRDGEQSQRDEHLQANPLQLPASSRPACQQKGDHHPDPDYRDMIEHQVDVGPSQHPRQPLTNEPSLPGTGGLSGIPVFISHPTGNIHLAASACNRSLVTFPSMLIRRNHSYKSQTNIFGPKIGCG